MLSQTQVERADNYAIHYNCRQMFKAFDPDMQTRIKNVCEVMRPPKLNIFGNDDYTPQEERRLLDLANQNKVQGSMCFIWYTSDQAWADFQTQWQALPEPETIRFQMYFEPVDNSAKP